MSEISAAAFALPIPKACWFESFDFDAVLFRNVIILVWEVLETLHDMVFALVMFAILGQVLKLQVLLLL